MSLDEYLGEVDRSLRGALSPEERDELLKELRGHVEDGLDACGDGDAGVDDLVAGLGESQAVATLERDYSTPRPERILLLASTEGERWPLLYGLGLSVWLTVIALVAGLAAMPLLKAAGNVIWDYPRFEEMNIARLPAMGILYLKTLTVPVYYATATVVAAVLLLSLIGVLSTKYRLGHAGQALHISLVVLEVYLIAAVCYTEFQGSSFFYVDDSPWLEFLYRWLSLGDLMAFGIIACVGFLVILADSYVISSAMRPVTRVFTCALMALLAFGSFHQLISFATQHFRIDSPMSVLASVHLLVSTPIVLLGLVIVVVLPEAFRAVERRARDGFGLAVVGGVAGLALLAGLVLSASASRSPLPKELANLPAVSHWSPPTDKRAFLMFYSDGRVECSARGVNRYSERSLRETCALPASALKLPAGWATPDVNFALWLAVEGGYAPDLSLLARNIISVNPDIWPRFIAQPIMSCDWIYLDPSESSDVARVIENSMCASPTTFSFLSEVYLWQGDYPRSRRYLEQAEAGLSRSLEQFGDSAAPPPYLMRSLEAKRIALADAPTEARVTVHDVRVVARLDGKPLAGLSVGLSPEMRSVRSYLNHVKNPVLYGSFNTRYVDTAANGVVEMNGVVSGPTAVVVTLSTETMSAVPGNYAIIVRSSNLDRKTGLPAAVTIDVVPAMPRDLLQAETSLAAWMGSDGRAGTLRWSPLKGATSYRVLCSGKSVGRTAETWLDLPKAHVRYLPIYTVLAYDSEGRLIGSDLSLNRLARLGYRLHDPAGHDWRPIAPQDAGSPGLSTLAMR